MNTASPENQRVLDLKQQIGIERLGIMSSQAWHDDPQSLLFTLSRYKFVSRIFRNFNNVLEIGCGDAFYSRLVQQQVRNLTVSDHDPLFIDDVQQRSPSKWLPNTACINPLLNTVTGCYDGIYFLDVLEHIPQEKEETFISNVIPALSKNGTLVIGMPSLPSQQYASEISRMGHVNCKTGDQFSTLMKSYFSSVSIFSMNDEVVHTGYWDMSHYLFAVCTHSI